MAAAPAEGARGGPSRNLLILQTPDAQAMSDWETVKQAIEERAPDIEVRIAVNGARNSVTRRWQAKRPSLVFSPVYLWEYEPAGGKIYAGQLTGKIRELELLTGLGLQVPRWAVLTPEAPLPREEWGEFVIVKPNRGSRGDGVRLIRTDAAQALFPQITGNGQKRFLVQKYIDNRDAADHQVEFRVVTLFGEPVMSYYRRATYVRAPLDEIADTLDGRVIITRATGQEREFIKDPQVLEFAKDAARRLPDIPVLGIDMVRRHDDGSIWLLETNLAGEVWHFSSREALTNYPAETRAFSYRQWDVLGRAAELLIARTRAEAT